MRKYVLVCHKLFPLYSPLWLECDPSQLRVICILFAKKHTTTQPAKNKSGNKVVHGINLPWLCRRIPRTEPWETWLWEQVAHYDHNCFLPRNSCSMKANNRNKTQRELQEMIWDLGIELTRELLGNFKIKAEHNVSTYNPSKFIQAINWLYIQITMHRKHFMMKWLTEYPK